jgi:hypothetical protein
MYAKTRDDDASGEAFFAGLGQVDLLERKDMWNAKQERKKKRVVVRVARGV